MSRLSIRTQVFIAILTVALGTGLAVGFAAHFALAQSFADYLGHFAPGHMAGQGMGRMMGTAEQTFIARVDYGVVLATAVAVLAAAGLAIALAIRLTRPIQQLEVAAQKLAAGDRENRVEIEGASEVAAVGTAFNQLADSLENSENLRRRLVADVAHEIRNPLAAARGQAEGMLDGVLPLEMEHVESLVDDLLHLSALVDELHELSVAEAGGLRYDMGQLDLYAIAVSEVRRAQPLAAAGVSLQLLGHSDEALVWGDSRRLAQVMRNLLSNATRHTADGSIVVKVATNPDGQAMFSVRDTGEGIAPDDLPNIFERFYRGDTSRSSDSGGSGLGLAISRAIVEDHQGKLYARSILTEGTELGFLMPTI